MRNLREIIFCGIAGLILLVASCNAKTDKMSQPVKTVTDGDVLVTVASKPITLRDFKDYCFTVGGLPLEKISSEEEKRKKLTAMVNDLVFSAEARKRGVEQGDKFKTRMGILETKIIPPVYVRKQISDKIVVTDEDLKKHLTPQPLRIRLQAFLSDNEALCYEVLRRAQGGEDFGEIIRASSEGITREKKGELGYVEIGKDDLFLAEEQSQFRSLNKGEFSKVFKTRIGYMVVKVLDVLTPEEQSRRMAESLRDRVKLEKEREAYDALVSRLRKRENVRLDEKNLDRIGRGNLEGMSTEEVQKLPLAWIGKKPVPYYVFAVLGATTFHSPSDLSRIVDNHLNERLVTIEAKKIGLDTDPEIERERGWLSANTLARLVIDDISEHVKVTEADYRSYYDTHQSEFRIPESVRLSVIEVRNRTRAEKALGMLGEGREFASVLEEVSDDPRLKKSGGDIGYYPTDRLLGEIKEALPKMKVGDTSPVIGITAPKERYLLFRLTDRKPAGVAEYGQMKKEVVFPRIVAQKREASIKEFMENAGKATPVSWNRETVEALFKTGAKEAGK